jgi:hypothetical protein
MSTAASVPDAVDPAPRYPPLSARTRAKPVGRECHQRGHAHNDRAHAIKSWGRAQNEWGFERE